MSVGGERHRRWHALVPLVAYALGLGVLVAFVACFATPLAFLDDLTQAKFLLPEARLDLPWLWEQHNEHRIPLPRLIHTGSIRWVRDFRAPTWLDVALLAGLVWILMESARRLRGRRSVHDAFFPLLFFSLGQAENHLNGFQVVFVLPIALAGLALAIVAGPHAWDRPRAALGLAACVALLPACGVPGIALGLPLAAWLVAVGSMRLCAPERAARRAALVLVAGGAGAVALAAATFLGLDLLADDGMDSPARIAVVAVQALAQACGWLNREAWPGSGGLALALLAAGCIPLVRGLRGSADDSRRAAALAAVVAGTAVIALAIGVGRAHYQEHAGMLSRYGTLMLLAPAALWFAALRWGGASTASAHGCALALAAAIWAGNLGQGWSYGLERRAAADRLLRDVRDGKSWDALASAHGTIFLWTKETFEEALRHLARAGLPPFERPRRRLRAAAPFESFLDRPDEVRSSAEPVARSWEGQPLTVLPPGSELRWRIAAGARHFAARAWGAPFTAASRPDCRARLGVWIESEDGSRAGRLMRFELGGPGAVEGEAFRELEIGLTQHAGRTLVLRVEDDSELWGGWSHAGMR